MRLLILFILPLFLLNASDVYVKVGEAKTKSGLSYAYSKLNMMNMRMFYKTNNRGYDTTYSIYSGPYRSQRTQAIALKNVRNFFQGATLVKLSSSKNSPVENVSKTQTQNDNQDFLKDENNYIKKGKLSIGFGLGYATAPSSHVINSGTVTIDEPKNSGINSLLKLNYDFSEDFAGSINYMHMYAQDLVFDNIYATTAYKFTKLGNYEPYFGVSFGMSALSWNKSPLEQVSGASKNNSETYLYGTELGFTYDGYEKLIPFVQYHCMFMEHATNLTVETVNTSKLQHKTFHTILLGIAYSF